MSVRQTVFWLKGAEPSKDILILKIAFYFDFFVLNFFSTEMALFPALCFKIKSAQKLLTKGSVFLVYVGSGQARA